MSQVHPLDCKACAAIDAFDGKIDGKVFSLDHWNVTHERKHFALLQKKKMSLLIRLQNLLAL